MHTTTSLPVISLVGRTNSGKTTFIEKLLALLGERGMKVAVAKQHHRDVPTDIEGKDSWRYAQAGAACSILATPHKLSLFYRQDTPATVAELAQRMSDDGFDLLLIESFGDADEVDRYVVARVERTEEPAFAPEETAGIITDDPALAARWEASGSRSFDLNDPPAFAAFLIAHYHCC